MWKLFEVALVRVVLYSFGWLLFVSSSLFWRPDSSSISSITHHTSHYFSAGSVVRLFVLPSSSRGSRRMDGGESSRDKHMTFPLNLPDCSISRVEIDSIADDDLDDEVDGGGGGEVWLGKSSTISSSSSQIIIPMIYSLPIHPSSKRQKLQKPSKIHLFNILRLMVILCLLLLLLSPVGHSSNYSTNSRLWRAISYNSFRMGIQLVVMRMTATNRLWFDSRWRSGAFSSSRTSSPVWMDDGWWLLK